MQVHSTLAIRPRAASSTPPPAPIPNTEPSPDQVSLRRTRGAIGVTLGAGVGAALGLSTAALGVPPAIGGTAGAALGALVGGYGGYNWPAPIHDLKALSREAGNRFTSRWNAFLHRVDQAVLQERPTPLGGEHLLAARSPGRQERLYDGYDSSRSLAALYAREGAADQSYQVQAEVAYLRAGAEHGNLDTTVLVDWGPPAGQRALPFGWQGEGSYKLAVKIDTNHSLQACDGQDGPLESAGQAEHSSVFSRVNLDLDKKVLRELGWQDGQPLRLEALTAKDGETRVHSRLSSEGGRDQVFRWEGKLVYYAVTDRFQNGDKTNDQGVVAGDPERFHGGDWQGLIDKLDYLQSLNVDCLWVSCPYENQRDFFGKDGFHGYWPRDFRAPEPNFGDKAKLKELCDKAREKNIKVMLDVVVNHTAYDHEWVNDPSKRDWFHQNGKIGGPGQWKAENGSLAGLPDLEQAHPEVAEELLSAHKEWLQETGLSAFRMDAVRHVPEEYLRRFDQEMRSVNPDFFAVGEAYWQDPNFVAGYQNRTMDSMFDFPLAYRIRYVFSGDEERTLKDRLEDFKTVKSHANQEALRLLTHPGMESMEHLSKAFDSDLYYDNPNKLGTMLDNHDMIRFMSDCKGDLGKLEMATAFLMAARGTPHVYYGTEVGMTGVGPANRNDMAWGQNPQWTRRFAELTGARRSSEALQFGHQVELLASRHTYALSRMRADEEVVCVFNNHQSESRELSFKLHGQSQIPDGTVLQDMVGDQQATVREGRIELTLPPRSYAFLRWKKAGPTRADTKADAAGEA